MKKLFKHPCEIRSLYVYSTALCGEYKILHYVKCIVCIVKYCIVCVHIVLQYSYMQHVLNDVSYVLCVVYVLYYSICMYVHHVLDAVSYVLCVVCVVLSHSECCTDPLHYSPADCTGILPPAW